MHVEPCSRSFLLLANSSKYANKLNYHKTCTGCQNWRFVRPKAKQNLSPITITSRFGDKTFCHLAVIDVLLISVECRKPSECILLFPGCSMLAFRSQPSEGPSVNPPRSVSPPRKQNSDMNPVSSISIMGSLSWQNSALKCRSTDGRGRL